MKGVPDLPRFAPHARDVDGCVSHTLNGPELFGQLLHFLGPPPDGNNLQAIVMVKVNMLGRYDHLLIIVLKVRYLVEEVPLVVVVT